MAKLVLAGPLRRWADRSPRFLKLLWSLETGFVRLLAAVLRLLPVDTASRLGGRLMRFFGPHTKKSRTIRDNLRIAFPEKTAAEIEALVKDIWTSTGAVLAEYPHIGTIRAQAERRLRIEIRGETEALIREKRPVVFVSVHQANWELPAVAASQLGIPLAVVYTPLQNPGLDRLLARARQPLGCRVVERAGAMRQLLRFLKEGVSVGLIMDQRVDAGEPLPFFGQDKPTSLTAAQMAVRTGTELIPVQIQRLEGARFLTIFHEPVRAEDPGADSRAKAIDMTRKINGLFEEWIRERPGEWYCPKRRWPKPLMRRLLGQRKGQ